MIKGALYNSIDRINLIRKWDATKTNLNIIMYYPSTADSKTDDMTIKRCIDIAKFNEYGSISVYNIQEDVFESSIIKEICKEDIVLAWGNKLSKSKSEKIVKLLKGAHLLCFGKLKNGNPSLPTRLAKDTKIIRYDLN
jgi:hypothetical protein